MEVIMLESAAFHALIEKVVARIKQSHSTVEDRWVPRDIAMKKLGISSKTTLQRLRDTGQIRFSKTSKKIILYDVRSIESFLSHHAKNTF